MKPDKTGRNPVSRIAIDTGGTFTDGIAVLEDGETRRVKVLSNAALRGRVMDPPSGNRIQVDLAPLFVPKQLLIGFTASRPGGEPLAVVRGQQGDFELELDRTIELERGEQIELRAPFDAPRLAMHLLLGTNEDTISDKALALRVATTRGTNALLENKGAPFAMVLDEGLEDLLEIGDQSRPDIFALDVRRDRLRPAEIRGIGGRLASDGSSTKPIDEADFDDIATALSSQRGSTIGIALAHAWRTPEREEAVADALRKRGFERVICSTELSRSDQLLPRAETTAVEATLSPILGRFLDDLLPDSVNRKDDAVFVMTSAGGLEPAGTFRAKDGLLSGPAGGVSGAARSAGASGFEGLLGFDMGGTSTDVSRHQDDFVYRFETKVGPARIQAPCIAIETVAAGGGSICHVTDEGLAVGPRSAGASPGPACYGAGGPLTITDVNLLLGRGAPEHFGIPIDLTRSEAALEELRRDLRGRGFDDAGRMEILEGLRDIADERMAEAMRSISIREGVDPRRHILVPFGGAGGQHGCAIAERLGMETILIPSDTGLLSAVGLLHAEEERFAERTIMQRLDTLDPRLRHTIRELEDEALASLASPDGEVRRRLVALRLEGQDSVIQLEYDDDLDMRRSFSDAFEAIYGYPTPRRPIEVAWARVVTIDRSGEREEVQRLETPSRDCEVAERRTMNTREGPVEVPLHLRNRFRTGDGIHGPALVQEAGATVVVETGWYGVVQPNGSLILTRERHALSREPELHGGDGAAAAELVSSRLGAIATGMGRLLERTALSVNVKQRLDFSCAILDAKGHLLVNAPHMPIHLGSMGLCVRRTVEMLDPGPRDVIVTNHPACGGSHLPDVTTIAPIHERIDGGRRLGFVAVRAHHAEIGGSRPGSTPPFARTLVEEGVLIPPTRLVADGRERFDDLAALLDGAPWPTRRREENLADLAAQVASTRHGVERIIELAAALGTDRYLELSDKVRRNAARAAADSIATLGDFERRVTQSLDDGSVIKLHVKGDGRRLLIDFTGTSGLHPGNFNAPVAIATGATVYIMRLLADRPIPMNEGLLDPVDLVIPPGMLDPAFSGDATRDPAVCAGNTETSQRIVDTLLLAFELAACSQGTMNNLLLGNDTFGYYETICGGAGATEHGPGCPAVHTHMTNTRITDPETLEARYPVRLETFRIRRGTGGTERHPGGDGVTRALRALEPLDISLVAQHRKEAPFGLSGGGPGTVGEARAIRVDGSIEPLEGSAECSLQVGDVIEISTPGGGGWGA